MKGPYSYKVCFCFRRRFMRAASNEAPTAIKEVFRQYSSEGGVMGAEELQQFMEKVQGDGAAATREAAQKLIDAVKPELKYLKVLQKKGFSVDSFYRFLFSDENAALPPRRTVYQDMNGPLSHYFIYTGHNSYLTGNQLSSECSDAPIIQALERGVRVVELDLWPNKTGDNVDVLHGGTLTRPVELIKCLRSIKKHAFVAFHYPVIITFEDHLTPDLQDVVAQMLVDTFGDTLYTSDQSESQEKFPSPAELMNRILISTKPPIKYTETRHSFHEIKVDPQHKEKKKKKKKKKLQGDDEEAWGGDASDHDEPTPDNSRKLQHEASERYEEEGEDDDDPDGKAQQQVAATEYKHLIAIAAKKLIKGDLESSLRIDPQRVTRLSLSESALEKAASSHGAELIRFTQRNLLRIYPKGSRVTSSNYKPLLAWTHGAQMVALNMQGYGKALWLMQGMFRANGGCGYVRKPDILLNDDPDHLFNPNPNPNLMYPLKTTLKVRVYAGDGWRYDYGKHYFDTYSPPDFYTRVGIAGVPADTKPMQMTKAIEDNWTPVWDEEFVFPLTVPELALLRIEVYEYDMSDKDDFAGQTCLPVWELRTGIRSVRLCNHKGETLPSVKLLMRFQFV